ncbi:MAG: glycosyltransferase [Vulcanisaeta sp.]|uniref:glycosyltransferase n=1 Tax=Vulcanisaeta sp. TaxID=2020871 RepID=UPI003D0B4153
MVKVLHISTEYPPYRVIGTLAFQIRDLVTQLSNKYEIYLVHPANFDGSYMDGNVHIYTVRDSWFSDVIAYMHFLLVEILSRIPYVIPRDLDLVHAHEWIASVIAKIISQRLRVPYIVSAYSTESIRSGGAMSLLSLTIRDWEKYAFSSANYVIAHNKPTFESLRDHYGINAIEIRNVNDLDKIYDELGHAKTKPK